MRACARARARVCVRVCSICVHVRVRGMCVRFVRSRSCTGGEEDGEDEQEQDVTEPKGKGKRMEGRCEQHTARSCCCTHRNLPVQMALVAPVSQQCPAVMTTSGWMNMPVQRPAPSHSPSSPITITVPSHSPAVFLVSVFWYHGHGYWSRAEQGAGKERLE